MERRKFIIGAGALATGSAAATGTGALSVSTNDRTMSVNVVNDDQGIIRFDDRTSHDIVQQRDGEIAIDFGAFDGSNDGSPYTNDAKGVNQNSTVVVGRSFSSPQNGDGLNVVNQSTRDWETVKYTFEPSSSFQSSSEDTYVGVSAASDTDYGEMFADNDNNDGSSVSMTVDGFDSGEEQELAFKVSTIGADLSDDLTGTLTIETDYDDSP